jgi:hypothetical protein
MNDLLDLSTGRLALVIAPGQALERLLDLTAHLAPQGQLRVLDGGNSFNVYTVASYLRRRTPHLKEALQNIRVARAFTCYQMLALLESTPTSPAPTLVLDLLATFYDESVSLDERQRLLLNSLAQLRRLSLAAPVGVAARLPPADQPERHELLALLEGAAHQVWRFEPEIPRPPLRLF